MEFCLDSGSEVRGDEEEEKKKKKKKKKKANH